MIIAGYIPKLDTTVIFEDKFDSSGNVISSKIINFYYGEPDEQSTKDFYNDGIKDNYKPEVNFKEKSAKIVIRKVFSWYNMYVDNTLILTHLTKTDVDSLINNMEKYNQNYVLEG